LQLDSGVSIGSWTPVN